MLVLTDAVISKQFEGLTIASLTDYQHTLTAALQEYAQDPSIIPPRVVESTPYGATHLFMTSMGSRVGMKAITASKEGFNGITTVLDRETGAPLAVINGSTLTAFRTALCSSLGLVKTYPVEADYNGGETLVVFGVGDQAVWHVRLALILYPKRFAKVVCVNRTLAKAVDYCAYMAKGYMGLEFVPLAIDNKGELKKHFETTSVVFTCVPSTVPTVTLDLTCERKGRLFIGAIGSYKPQMIEVHGDVINEVLAAGGKVLVDSKEHCLHEAGEFIQNGITEDSLMEYSAVYSGKAVDTSFLEKSPIVLSKIVGLCIMDVWVGAHCMANAQKEGTGIEIANF